MMDDPNAFNASCFVCVCNADTARQQQRRNGGRQKIKCVSRTQASFFEISSSFLSLSCLKIEVSLSPWTTLTITTTVLETNKTTTNPQRRLIAMPSKAVAISALGRPLTRMTARTAPCAPARPFVAVGSWYKQTYVQRYFSKKARGHRENIGTTEDPSKQLGHTLRPKAQSILYNTSRYSFDLLAGLLFNNKSISSRLSNKHCTNSLTSSMVL
jgi:hypothetical protein